MKNLLLSIAVIAVTMFAARAELIVNFTLSAPGVQQSPLQGQTGSLTEDFNSFTPWSLPNSGNLAVGSYTATTIGIYPASAWGGAGGTGTYATTGDNGTLSINLNPTKYVGFWWSAGNGGNLVRIYGTGNTLLGTFDSYSIISLIGPKATPNNVVAANGQIYSGSLWYGNPNGDFGSPGSAEEPYAYVNLRLSDPTVNFTRIEFTGWVFEFDNITGLADLLRPRGSGARTRHLGRGSVACRRSGIHALAQAREGCLIF